jgi:hypothetical protein
MKTVNGKSGLVRGVAMALLLCLAFCLPGCASKSVEPTFIIPYKDFIVLKYYRTLNGDLVIGFSYGNSSVWLVAVEKNIETENDVETINFSIRGGEFDDIKKSGYSPLPALNIEGGYSAIAMPKIFDDTHQLVVNYRDDSGLHRLEYAGTLEETFKPYIPQKQPTDPFAPVVGMNRADR